MTEMRQAACVVGVFALARLVVASRWGVLMDESYYWTWSEDLALGYFDHPPLIAWVLACMPRSALGLRGFGIVLQTAGALALLRHAARPVPFAAYVSVVPMLAGVGLFATPDALLLGIWPLAMAASARGGRAWLLAGVLVGLGILAKAPAVLLLPLLFAATSASERRSPWPWLGLVLCALVVSPYAVWSFANGHPALAFQAQHGLGGSGSLWGPLQVVGQQLAAATPLLGLAGLWWCVRWPSAQPLAWWTSAPVLLLFALAALMGAPEANWAAPAWWGISLGLAASQGPLNRLAQAGGWLSLFGVLALVVHVERPLLPLSSDPAHRLLEGELVAIDAMRWAMPAGERPFGPRAGEGLLIVTERYQEAAAIRYHTGLRAVPWKGCGRPNQLEANPLADEAVFVRPSRGGPVTCLGEDWEVGRKHVMRPTDRWGRTVGRWDWVETTSRRVPERRGTKSP